MALEPLKSQLRILASEHHRAGRWDDAAACYGEVLALDPGDAACHYLLAFVEAARGSPDRARDCVLAALAIEPSNPDFLFLLGELERQRGDLAASIRAFEGAIQRTQPVPERLVQLSDLYLAVGRPGAAETRAREAVGMSGADPEALHMLADTVRAQGRADESLDIYRAAAAGDAIYTVRHQNLLMTMNYAGALAPDEVFRAHRDAGRMPNLNPVATKLASHWPSPPASTGPTRLRVGYVSADFGHHVVSFFFEPVAAAHHRDRVEVFCYFTGGVEDEQCARIRSTGVVWRNVANLAVDDLVALMRADELHVAVDLSGHTAGNRLEVFARRVAAAQVSWLGYPNTSGVPAIDFRLTDATCDPVGMTATLHTETLWRLPRCFLVYRPRDDAPALTGPPGEVNGFVTFGCFNRIEKLSTEALRLWARVLAAVPGSRLLLKARNLGEPDLASAIRARFDAAGGDVARLDLELPTAAFHDHLARYGAIDIALDSHPYCGTTTTCEALWMGVPVVTLAGTTHASRVGASLVRAAGVGWLAARDIDEYVATASRLAASPGELANLRKSSRTRLQRSELTDPESMVTAIEKAYYDMAAQAAR